MQTDRNVFHCYMPKSLKLSEGKSVERRAETTSKQNLPLLAGQITWRAVYQGR